MTALRIEPWRAADRPLLDALLTDPVMMEHLGGPEAPQKLESRQRRYQAEGSRQYRIVDAEGQSVGYVGYWERPMGEEEAWEVGWAVLPAFQGRGYATTATELLLDVIRKDDPRPVHAFPSVDNAASNAVCRKLGFQCLGAFDFGYPPGHPIRCNDWRLDMATRQ